MRTRQFVANDLSSLITFFWLLLYAVIIYIFYRILRRIENTLAEIKKQLESKSSTSS